MNVEQIIDVVKGLAAFGIGVAIGTGSIDRKTLESILTKIEGAVGELIQGVQDE